jgi:hypothetical protein
MAADHDHSAWNGGRGDVLLQTVGDCDQTAGDNPRPRIVVAMASIK